MVFSLPAQPATLGDPDRAAKLVASVARACAAVTGVCEAPMPGAPSFASTGSGVAPASPAASMVAPAAHDNLHAIMLLATALAPIAGNTVPLRKGRTEGAPKHVVLSALKVCLSAHQGDGTSLSRSPPPTSCARGTPMTWS